MGGGGVIGQLVPLPEPATTGQLWGRDGAGEVEVRGGGVGDVTGDECGGAGGEVLSSREADRGEEEEEEEEGEH